MIHVLDFVCQQLIGEPTALDEEITGHFETKCTYILNSMVERDDLISLNSLQAAISILGGFNNTKLILTGYDIDPEAPFITNVLQLVNQQAAINHAPVPIFSPRKLNLMQRIMFFTNTKVRLNDIGRNNGSAPEIVEAMEQLNELGLGIVRRRRTIHNRLHVVFTKVTLARLTADPMLLQSVTAIRMNAGELQILLAETEGRLFL